MFLTRLMSFSYKRLSGTGDAFKVEQVLLQ